MSKHVLLDIRTGHFTFQINATAVAAEAALDGIHVIILEP